MNTISTPEDLHLDVRGLEAPEPLERALEALRALHRIFIWKAD